MQQGLGAGGRAKPEPAKPPPLPDRGEGRGLQGLRADDVIRSTASQKQKTLTKLIYVFVSFFFSFTGTVNTNDALSGNGVQFCVHLKASLSATWKSFHYCSRFSLKRKDGDGNGTLFNNEYL